MRARLRSLPVLVLIGSLGAAAGVPAQETPPPTAPAPAEEGVTLVFKHKAGQLQKFKGTLKVDAAVSPEGGASTLGSIPVLSTSALAFTEKVTGTRKGTGTLSLTLTSLVTNTDAFGTKIVNRFQHGKTSTTVNGKPATARNPAAAAAQLAELRKPAGFRRDPLGITTPIGSGKNAFGEIFGSTSFTIVQLPPNPVKVGDTWETTQRIRPTVVTGRAPFVVPEIEFRYTHTLTRIDTRNGKRQALIETSGSGAPVGEETTDTSLNQSITGTTRFDIDRGAVVSSQYNIILGMRLGLPPGAPTAGNGVNAVRIDGNLDVLVREVLTAAPAKKAKR